MSRIYYKGEAYIQEPPILANAIMMSEEQAREYNIIVNDSDEEEIVAYGGERVYLGDIVNDFIAGGIQVLQGTNEEFLAKVKPEHAYTLWINPNGSKDDTVAEATGSLVYQGGSFSNLIGRIYLNRTLSSENLTLNGVFKCVSSGSYTTKTTNNLSNVSFADARAYGLAFQFASYDSSTTYGQWGHVVVYTWIIAWTKNQDNEWEILASKKETNQSPWNLRIVFGSEGEYQYFMGIKGKYSYLTPEEFEELLEEHSPE